MAPRVNIYGDNEKGYSPSRLSLKPLFPFFLNKKKKKKKIDNKKTIGDRTLIQAYSLRWDRIWQPPGMTAEEWVPAQFDTAHPNFFQNKPTLNPISYNNA